MRLVAVDDKAWATLRLRASAWEAATEAATPAAAGVGAGEVEGRVEGLDSAPDGSSNTVSGISAEKKIKEIKEK